MNDAIQEIREIARQLPFAIDDMEAANALYLAWFKGQNAKDEQLLKAWAYCYVFKYFTQKYLTTGLLYEDRDLLVGDAYVLIWKKHDDVNEVDKFANWVSKVCKNLFRSYLRNKRNRMRLLDFYRAKQVERTVSDSDYELDHVAIHRILVTAILKLPEHFGKPLLDKYVYGKTYDQIAAERNLSPQTVRSYAIVHIFYFRFYNFQRFLPAF